MMTLFLCSRTTMSTSKQQKVFTGPDTLKMTLAEIENDSFNSDSDISKDEFNKTPMPEEQLSVANEEEDNFEIDDNDGRGDETGPEK